MPNRENGRIRILDSILFLLGWSATGSAVNYITSGSGMACCYGDSHLAKVPKGSVKFAMVRHTLCQGLCKRLLCQGCHSRDFCARG